MLAQPVVCARLTRKTRDPADGGANADAQRGDGHPRGFNTLLRFHNIDVCDQWVKVEMYEPGSDVANGGEYGEFAGCLTVPLTAVDEDNPTTEPKLATCKFRRARLGVAYLKLAAAADDDDNAEHAGCFLSSLDTAHPQARDARLSPFPPFVCSCPYCRWS